MASIGKAAESPLKTAKPPLKKVLKISGNYWEPTLRNLNISFALTAKTGQNGEEILMMAKNLDGELGIRSIRLYSVAPSPASIPSVACFLTRIGKVARKPELIAHGETIRGIITAQVSPDVAARLLEPAAGWASSNPIVVPQSWDLMYNPTYNSTGGRTDAT